LAERSYYNSKFGQRHNLITPNHCGLCHGIDHLRGICPFPGIDGWKGPGELNIISQRIGRYPYNSGHFTAGARY
jgi:hypothetical protein